MKFWSKLFHRRTQVTDAKPGLICSDCHARIHKHELYTVLVVRHKNCRDPRGVGQLVIPESCEKPELLP